jgi:hypothetical protein
MARQPDVQYIQMYNYGSTAHKLAPRPRYRKEQYQLPEQKPLGQKAKRTVFDPLSVCAIAVACVMLITMLVGMFRVAELSERQQELEGYVDQLREQRADLQKTYEDTYDLAQVEQRARQMGLVYSNEVYHIQMGTAKPIPQEEPGFTDRLAALFDELFAKAPR